ncbi:MAG: putative lipid II flippase FtsW [Gammaproteobacteria bacterium]
MTAAVMQSQDKTKVLEPIWFDLPLVLMVLALVAIGFVMVSSASMPFADTENYGYNPYHFVIRHAIYIGVGIVAAIGTMFVPTNAWLRAGLTLLGVAIFLLILVLIVGKEVNGSRRWLDLGLFTIQASELAKLFVVSYLASYLVRRREELVTQIKGFIKPLGILAIVTFTLLMEPDFGATVVIVATSLAMMFLAGARLWQFIVLSLVVGVLLGGLALTQSYRWHRLQSFLDPWQDPFGTGYQLTQSLIAFGRGDLWGLGLGQSIQKLSYLPEAHTDFVFAVLAEELGLIGVLAVLILYACLFVRIMNIGRKAVEIGQLFSGYMAWGLGITLALQAVINIGVNAGVLPTKGLTLPLISYGGSSLIMSLVTIAVILRIDYETKVIQFREQGIIPGRQSA